MKSTIKVSALVILAIATLFGSLLVPSPADARETHLPVSEFGAKDSSGPGFVLSNGGVLSAPSDAGLITTVCAGSMGGGACSGPNAVFSKEVTVVPGDLVTVRFTVINNSTLNSDWRAVSVSGAPALATNGYPCSPYDENDLGAGYSRSYSCTFVASAPFAVDGRAVVGYYSGPSASSPWDWANVCTAPSPGSTRTCVR